jgi:UDP-N-acetylmuramoyl-L-alanyl-D-glutamate--2,6-diaminopimelate ligase
LVAALDAAPVAPLDIVVPPGAPDDPELSRVTHDSRATEVGDLFCCVVGASHDGHDHASAAVASGASALLVERPLDLPVSQVVVADVREAMGPLAAAVAGFPSRNLTMVGVTGTNGKTTTAHLLGSVFEAAGRHPAVLGTLSGTRTTAEAPELQAELANLVVTGTQAVAMEVSSHALAQRRVDGTRFDVAVFTNLSPDHLDFHGDMDGYFAAKARLFTPALSERAVVNLDDERGAQLAEQASIPTEGYALADAGSLRLAPAGSTFEWRGRTVRLALPGRFNVSNALAAAGAAAALGIDEHAIVEGLGTLRSVPGRMERVEHGQPFTVIVDYAHTPDGLGQVLRSARELAGEGRVTVVFGCGGDRDPYKRPAMGATAVAGADVVIVTSDNSRSEDPDAIIDEILAGAPGASIAVEPDRRRAIGAALEAAEPHDVVVVAGKGHETTQITGDRVEPFDDRHVSAELLEAMGHQAKDRAAGEVAR